jgi:hypothetical protein
MAGKFQDNCAYPPRMMNADRAAAYLDISKTKFLEGVGLGIWPAPRDVGGLPRWDRHDLDSAVDAMSERKKRLAPGRKSLADMLEAEGAASGGAQ